MVLLELRVELEGGRVSHITEGLRSAPLLSVNVASVAILVVFRVVGGAIVAAALRDREDALATIHVQPAVGQVVLTDSCEDSDLELVIEISGFRHLILVCIFSVF